MSSTLVKRSMRFGGHRTSVALEPQFWAALEAIVRVRQISLPTLFAEINKARAASKSEATLASAARVYSLSSPVLSQALSDGN